MIDEIITGVSLALDSEFNADGNTYAIYAEKVEQGLTEPCFIIDTVQAARTPLLDMRGKLSYELDVIFIPKDGTRAEMLETADTLFSVLHMITLPDGGGLLGFDMRHEITDDVLHFFVRYPVMTNRERDDAKMENLTLNYSADLL